MRTTILLAILCPALALAQGGIHKDNLSPLTIGDTLPFSILYPGLQSLRAKPTGAGSLLPIPGGGRGEASKLIILDFFATWCYSCIKELPRLNQLQQQFADSLQIILVTAERSETITAANKRIRSLAVSRLPMLTADSILRRFFPHKLLPHKIWLKEGRVVAITGPDEFTATNIRLLLQGASPGLPLKQDQLDFNRNRPLLEGGNGGNNNSLLCRSLLTANLPGIPSGTSRQTGEDLTRYTFVNQPLLLLYQQAWGFPPNRVVLEIADSSRFIQPATGVQQWNNQNAFAYELTVPASLAKEDALRLMAADLDRYFHLRSRIEVRSVPGWALTVAKPAALPLSAGSESSIKEQADTLIFTNTPLAALVDALNTAGRLGAAHTIIVDESCCARKLNIKLPLEALTSLDRLKQTLRPYGLALTPVHRRLSMFVLTEDPPLSPPTSWSANETGNQQESNKHNDE